MNDWADDEMGESEMDEADEEGEFEQNSDMADEEGEEVLGFEELPPKPQSAGGRRPASSVKGQQRPASGGVHVSGSLFVGRGLGLPKTGTVFPVASSAKEVLARILREAQKV